MIQKYSGYDGILDTIVFELDTINKCNFNCIYCEKQQNIWNPNKDMEEWGKTNNILELIPFFKSFPNKFRIHLLGGEPTLHKDLFSFIKALPNTDIKLFTNGSNVNKITKLLAFTHLSYTISLHMEELKSNILIKLIDSLKLTIESLLNSNTIEKKPNLKFMVLLYDIEANFEKINKFLSLISLNGFNYDYYFPFDENGYYNLNNTQVQLYNKLLKQFPLKNLSLGNESNLNHIDIYNRRNKISQNKLCYKNLWLINYKNEFKFDGTNLKYNFKDINRMVNDNNYSVFKHKLINCSDECWCPANNYYSKIRF